MALDSGQDVFEELLKTFEECREPNWDGYGAQAVREETYDLAHQFLAALPLSTPVPSIGAEPDGQITVEWYRSPQWTMSVSISPDGDSHTQLCSGRPRPAVGSRLLVQIPSRRGPDPPGYGCMKIVE